MVGSAPALYLNGTLTPGGCELSCWPECGCGVSAGHLDSTQPEFLTTLLPPVKCMLRTLEPRCRSRVCLGPSPGHPGHTLGDTLLRGAMRHMDDPLHEDGDVSQAAGAAGLCHSDSCSAGDHTHQTLSPFSTESESKPDPKAISEKPEEKPVQTRPTDCCFLTPG